MKSFLSALALLLFSTPAIAADVAPSEPSVAAHTVLQIAAADGRFETLVAAVNAAGLAKTLSGDGPFTVFAPTDAAFAALPSGTVETLLRPENRQQLTDILAYHLVAGRVEASDLLSAGSAVTASGAALPLGLSIGGATIVQTDIMAENGIIHVIDAVLLPPTSEDPVSSTTGDRMSSTPGNQRIARAAREVITLAVDRGAPLYNLGQEVACAAIYEVAAVGLLTNADLPAEARRALSMGLERASRTHGADNRAWRLREGLDAAYTALGGRMMTTAPGH